MNLPTAEREASLPQARSQVTLIRGLSLLDSILLLAGGIIGSSIFLTAKDIAGPLPHPALFLLVWVMGALISMCAACAFAELGSMFPDSGGQYIYLREAFGDLIAFLYGWMLFAVANGGTIAALSVASAAYLGEIIPAISQKHVVRAFAVPWLRWAGHPILGRATITLTRAHIFALASIMLVTCINVVGLRRGAILQNLATWAKFVAMAAFILLGLGMGKGSWSHFTAHPPGIAAGLSMGLTPGQWFAAMGVGMIAVFWAYDGWVYITWVAGEVKDPRRNVPRAMVLGIIVVAAIYIAMNVTYVYAMPLNEVAQHETIAHAAASVLFSPAAATWLSLTIALSCFGAMASCTLSGARVYFAMAQDGVFFRRMAEIHPKWRTPALSLIGQGIWAAGLTLSGRYDQLYTYVIYGMVLSYTLTVVGLFVLRGKRPDIPRPYRCTGYPWLPGLYVLLGTGWTINTIVARPREALAGTILVLLGVPGYLYWKRRTKPSTAR
ncbi:MAG TPA: amino acid permease [Terriglobales bacterium]|nr:amino acid permease [Terriglobales bacterium]